MDEPLSPRIADNDTDPSSSSSITFARLRKLNIIAASLHLVQFIFMLAATFAVPDFKNFKLPLNRSVLKFTAPPEGQGFYTEIVPMVDIHMGPLVAMFFLLSALFQGLTVLPGVNERYNAQIDSGINYFRWYEYALSSSVMIFIIAMFTGIYDWATLLCIFCLNATMNLLGLLMERINQDQPRESISWLPFLFGCFAGIPPWIVVFAALLTASSPPSFVYGIFVAYFIMFNTFPLNMVLQYKKVGKWADYRYGELVYIILSLVAKSLLGWLVFGGLNQPNNFTT